MNLPPRLKRFLYAITGGRPMIYVGQAFQDKVSREMVNYYRDPRTEGYWLANGAWDTFRVECRKPIDFSELLPQVRELPDTTPEQAEIVTPLSKGYS